MVSQASDILFEGGGVWLGRESCMAEGWGMHGWGSGVCVTGEGTCVAGEGREHAWLKRGCV